MANSSNMPAVTAFPSISAGTGSTGGGAGAGAGTDTGISLGGGEGGGFHLFQAAAPVGNVPAGTAPNIGKIILGVIFMAINFVVEVFKVFGDMFKVFTGGNSAMSGKKVDPYGNPIHNNKGWIDDLFGNKNKVNANDISGSLGSNKIHDSAMGLDQYRVNQQMSERLKSLEGWRSGQESRGKFYPAQYVDGYRNPGEEVQVP